MSNRTRPPPSRAPALPDSRTSAAPSPPPVQSVVGPSGKPCAASTATAAASTVLLLATLAGCAAGTAPVGGWGAGDGPGDRTLAALGPVETVRNLPKSARGNMAEYTVRGQRYRTLESAAGFRERGVASWYGAKFHGRETSSGEPFDMHALTAAHRRLPLPTFVRVTNLANGVAVVVKVNDRGPFIGDRIIDLSYAAALRLDMLDSGTAEVAIEALSTHVDAAPVSDAAARAVVARDDAATSADTAPSEPGAANASAAGADAVRVIQIGAFGDDARARALARRAGAHLDEPPRVVRDAARTVWRVRVGPLADADAVAAALAGLAAAGIDDYRVMAATAR